MIRNNAKVAWRNIFKDKLTSAINLTGLSVGMAAAVLMLFWVQHEISYNNYHSNVDRLYRITNSITVNPTETWVWETSPALMGEAAVNEIPEVERAARLLPSAPMVVGGNGKLFTESKIAYVDSDWFDLFDYTLAAGIIGGQHWDEHGLVLTEKTANKYFDYADAVGKVVAIDGRNYTVQAVVENNPANSSFQFDVMIPLPAPLSDSSIATNAGWGNFNFITFLKLRADAGTAGVITKLNTILLNNKKDNSVVAGLRPLKDIYFEEGLQSSVLAHGNKKNVYVFSMLAFLLLFTACINYVNLTTARASTRSKEVSIRKIAGAQRGTLLRQFLMESVIMSVLALAITLLLIRLSLPLFNTLTEKNFVFTLTSPALWTVLIGTLILATLLNGIYPAILLSSFKPVQVFRGQSFLKVKDTTLRKTLVVFQFTLSVMLTVATIVIYKQLTFIQQTDPGYDASQVITMEIPYDQHSANASSNTAFKQTLIQQRSIAGVSMAGSPVVGLNNLSSGNIDWDGRDTAFNPSVVNYRADAAFQTVLGLQLTEGSWFEESVAGQQNYILNETAAKLFDMHGPLIGQRFAMDGVQGRISGVIKDFHYKSLHEKIGPMVIRKSTGDEHFVFIKTIAGSSDKALADIGKIWKSFYPAHPFNYTFLDDTFNETYRTDINALRIVISFSFITILISALGLFGLATFTMQHRKKEIGIRKALGSPVAGIVKLVSAEFVRLVAAAIIIACPLAWHFMNNWLADFAYRIAIQWWMFAMAGGVAMVVTILTVCFHALKMALANPVKSLRTE